MLYSKPLTALSMGCSFDDVLRCNSHARLKVEQRNTNNNNTKNINSINSINHINDGPQSKWPGQVQEGTYHVESSYAPTVPHMSYSLDSLKGVI